MTGGGIWGFFVSLSSQGKPLQEDFQCSFKNVLEKVQPVQKPKERKQPDQGIERDHWCKVNKGKRRMRGNGKGNRGQSTRISSSEAWILF